jgi:hypothetical protein
MHCTVKNLLKMIELSVINTHFFFLFLLILLIALFLFHFFLLAKDKNHLLVRIIECDALSFGRKPPAFHQQLVLPSVGLSKTLDLREVVFDSDF